MPPSIPSRTAGSKKRAPFQRDEPDLPAEFESNGALEAESGALTLQDRHVQDATLAGAQFESLRVDGSILDRLRISGGQFGSLLFQGCPPHRLRFRQCARAPDDLGAGRVHRLQVDRPLYGRFEWQSVLIRNGDVACSQLRAASFAIANSTAATGRTPTSSMPTWAIAFFEDATWLARTYSMRTCMTRISAGRRSKACWWA